ncbi:proline iminopeptidase [Mucilaginibacter sp. SG538B]|uniref:proline iminopeptidase-family hydrolase n=1 Tax=Mucilaginibacter sp. SG538B TaxID=2587021 RepID=UPI00159E7AAD|nr:proline iminopeptidase-family hydrolase [Mucilaginibacter sp. SG538B]NVM66719.1 proline iminopeptidase [Mucilaginibacter sp. SG538B]
MKNTLIWIMMIACMACRQPQSPSAAIDGPKKDSIKTGGSRLIGVGGGHRVWTKKIGEGKIKVLLLHGGPGFSHDYMECFEDFLPKEGMEIYYYDQLGCGNSDTPTDTSLWTIPRYVEEVEQVRKGLNLDHFYIVGHSWGSLLEMEYLKKYQSHVKGAVFSNMTASLKDFTDYSAELKSRIFSNSDKARYDSLDKLKAYTSPLYSDLLMNKLYTQVICRLPLAQWPEPLLRAFKKANQQIYMQMQGVDEFHVTGNFKDWDFWEQLPGIHIPVLVLGARHDEMNPQSILREGRLLPNSRTYLCPEGSHMAMYDDQQRYFNTLTTFLKDVEQGSFKPDTK